jgi:hypothetical protein
LEKKTTKFSILGPWFILPVEFPFLKDYLDHIGCYTASTYNTNRSYESHTSIHSEKDNDLGKSLYEKPLPQFESADVLNY